MITIECIVCGNEKELPDCKADRKFCGRKCYYLSKKGKISHRKGIKLSEETKKIMRDSHKLNCKCFRCSGIPWNKGFKYPEDQKSKLNLAGLEKGRNLVGDKSPNWKGDEVGYMALHDWVRKSLGKAVICNECASKETVDWANLSHKYQRNIEDWISLCRKCHIKYDKNNKGLSAKELFKNKRSIYV